MSFSPTSGGISGGELESAVRQMIENYFLGAEFTSSAGDSPKINRTLNLPDVSGFGDIMDSAVRTAVLRHMEENNLIGGGESGISEGLPIGGKGKTAGLASSIPGTVRSATSTVQNPMSAATSLISLLPQAAIITMAISMVPVIINELQKPGMPFDRRYKRDVPGEVLSSVEREEKAGIRQGLTIVRITSSPTSRGETKIGQTGQVGLTGIPRYSNDFEAFQKGVI